MYVEVSDVIDAPPETIDESVSNYREGHPAILPEPCFAEVNVEKGRKGTGTAIWLRMNVLGVERAYHMEVSEPEPGRVLVESDKQAVPRSVDPIRDDIETSFWSNQSIMNQGIIP